MMLDVSAKLSACTLQRLVVHRQVAVTVPEPTGTVICTAGSKKYHRRT